MEKFAKALGVEPYQLLFEGQGRPTGPKVPEHTSGSKPAQRLVKLFESMSSSNREVLLTLANKLSQH